MVVLIAFLHLYNVNPSIGETLQFYYPLIWILISIIYDVCGLLVAYLCYQICLRVVIYLLPSVRLLYFINILLFWFLFRTWNYIIFTSSYSNNNFESYRILFASLCYFCYFLDIYFSCISKSFYLIKDDFKMFFSFLVH